MIMNMNLGDWIALVMSNFGLAMLILAIIFTILHLPFGFRKLGYYEILFRWVALFALGFTGIYTFVMHAFFPLISAATIGWANSPFQFEVAMADLALGILGIISFKASYGFRLATVITSMCMLWGDAGGHIYQMLTNHNFSVGNAGSWFWLDILVPLILFICIMKLKRTN